MIASQDLNPVQSDSKTTLYYSLNANIPGIQVTINNQHHDRNCVSQIFPSTPMELGSVAPVNSRLPVLESG
jgi:hypothetical protein